MLDLAQVKLGNGVSIGAWPIRVGGQCEQVPDLADLKAEVPGMPDKSQGIGGVLIVPTLIAIGAVRYWKQVDCFVITYRLDLDAGASCELANGQIGTGNDSHCSLSSRCNI